MNREELKQLWFSLPRVKPLKEALERANTMLDSEIHEGYELLIK